MENEIDLIADMFSVPEPEMIDVDAKMAELDDILGPDTRTAEVDKILDNVGVTREEVSTDPLMATFGMDQPPSEPVQIAVSDANEFEPESIADPTYAMSPEGLLALRTEIQKTEAEFMEHYQKASNAEADLKEKQHEFEAVNAALIITRDSEKKIASGIEAVLKARLVIYAKAADEKVFDTYMQCKSYSRIEIEDRAAANTWARENYPSALVEELNTDMVITHLKGLPKETALPAFAVRKEGLEAFISKKFVKSE